MKLQGQMGSLESIVSNSVNIDVLLLRAATDEVHMSGSGNIRILVNQSIKSRVSGSGHVQYHSYPQIRIKIAGHGSVRPL